MNKISTKIPKRLILSEFILDKLSIPITKLFLRTNLSPNFITGIGGLFALLGIVAFPINKFVSCILILIYLILDLVDGDIAREKKIFSKLGWWGDKLIDKSVESFLIFSAFIEYKGNTLLEFSLFIILSFVYITQFSMEAINTLILKEKINNSFKETKEFKVKTNHNFKSKILLVLDNFTLGHSTLILLLTFGTLFFNEKIIIPFIALQAFYTFLYLGFCHYRICLKDIK